MSENEMPRSPVYPYAEMYALSIEGVVVLQDPASGGHWLDRGELAKLLRQDETVEDQVQSVEQNDVITHDSSRLCPLDTTPLVEHEFTGYGSLRVDICPQCGGMWLDAHELSQALTLLGRSPEPGNVEPPSRSVLGLLARLIGRSDTDA